MLQKGGELVVTPGRSQVQDWNRRVVALANNKGGVKKTSTTVNVAGQLAAGGFKVLVVALDTQRESAATDLGYADRSDHGASLAAAMINATATAKIITDVRPKLDVIADGPVLESVVAHLYGAVGRGERDYEAAFALLRPVLATVVAPYDLVLIDCPPGNKVLVDAALGAARYLLIPTATDQGSIRSMAGTAEAFVGARAQNPSLQLIGVLLTGSGTQASMTRVAAREAINNDFGGQAPLFDSFVRHAEAPASKARDRGLLAHELERDEAQAAASNPWWKLRGKHGSDPQPRRAAWTTNSSGLAGDYQRVTSELVDRITAVEQRTTVGEPA